ncbi:MAG: hypothetical protein EXS36_13270 [Pedosphaera sp.]|nr:hypothetical protein [Pedosphaera sp.]
MKKKESLIRERLRGMRDLSDDEQIQIARSLAATPDQRWQRHVNFLRSLGLLRRSARKRFVLL